jgi:hypothetical protein
MVSAQALLLLARLLFTFRGTLPVAWRVARRLVAEHRLFQGS